MFFSYIQAKHSDIFPTKSSLQLKIREVRQKLMAQSNPTPTTAGNVPSPLPQVSMESNINPAGKFFL